MPHRTPRALVVYESLSGTKLIAGAIATALEKSFDVRVGSIYEIPSSDAAHADLLIVGGPTHSRTMSTHASRVEAVDWSLDAAEQLQLLVDERTLGVREWIDSVAEVSQFCAFDTRANVPKLMSGAASRGISRALRKHGGSELAHAESFLVNANQTLVESEEARAGAWGDNLAHLPVA